MTSQAQLLMSRDLARQVITELKLAERPEFDPVLTRRVAARCHSLVVWSRQGSAAPDPGRARADELLRAAQRPADRQIARDHGGIPVGGSGTGRARRQCHRRCLSQPPAGRQAGADAQGRASGWRPRSRNCGPKWRTRKPKVEKFRAKANLFVGTNNANLGQQQLTELTTQLSGARAQKAELDAKSRLIRDMLKSGKPVESADVDQFRSVEAVGRAARRRCARSLPSNPRHCWSCIRASRSSTRRSRRSTARSTASWSGWCVQSKTTPPLPARASKPECQHRPHQEADCRAPAPRTCSCARLNVKQRRNAICSNPISLKYREATARESIEARLPMRA